MNSSRYASRLAACAFLVMQACAGAALAGGGSDTTAEQKALLVRQPPVY